MTNGPSFPLARARPPWPGVLPLTEAAAVLGVEPDTLRKRISRRHQPGFRQGARRYVVLLPAQWATWAETYQPPVRTPGPAGRPSWTEPEALPAPGESRDLAAMLEQLREAQQRAEELAGQVGYWMGRALALEGGPGPVSLSDTRERTPWTWWRRVLQALATVVG